MISVYGVDFPTRARLISALGFRSSMSVNFIKERYGSLEELVQKRLRLTDPVEIKRKLLELRDGDKAHGTIIDNSLLAILKAVYLQAPQETQDIVISSVASVTGESDGDLRSKIENFLS